jgi:hypothetical protein
LTFGGFQVLAVVVYNQAVREADLERRNQPSQTSSTALLDEEIFITQLHRRAVLLNDEFQKKVLDIVAEHAVADQEEQMVKLHRLSSVAFSNSSRNQIQFTSSLVYRADPNRAASDQQASSSKSSTTTGDTTATATLPAERKGSGAELFPARIPSLTTNRHPSMREFRKVKGDPGELLGTRMTCIFTSGASGPVEVWPAPEKAPGRMREKLSEYAAEGVPWPRCAQILDPVRASVVCEGPEQMVQVAEWFLRQAPQIESYSMEPDTRLVVCRVKNKFAFSTDSLVIQRSFPRARTDRLISLQISALLAVA